MNNFNYENKFNFYKNSNLVNKNYKMNKYLYKLNGGAGSFDLYIDFESLPDLGSGYFGKVKDYGDYAVKYISDRLDYDNEKKLFIYKLSIPCGIIDIVTKKYIFSSGDETINYDLTDVNYKQDDNKLIIAGDILEYIKSIGPIEIKDFDNINIDFELTHNELNIYDISKKIIGTYVNNRDNTYSIYIDTFKNMKLLYFNDDKQFLFYKNLGTNLNITITQHKISFEQRVLLCIDLIRQVSELIDVGIYHNDLKNVNIVIKQSADLSKYYLTIVDFGMSITLREIKHHYEINSDELEYKYNERQYNPVNILISKIIKNKFIHNGKKILFNKLKFLFEKSLYWILGAICINILSWSDIQNDLFQIHILGKYNYDNFSTYITKLKEHIFDCTDDGEYCDIYVSSEDMYDDPDTDTDTDNKLYLYDVINKLLVLKQDEQELLLELDQDEQNESLSKYYSNLYREPYILYLAQRKESNIDY